MARPELSPPPVAAPAIEKMNRFHLDTVAEVRDAVVSQPVVVVGMAWNPVVKRARKILDEAGIAYHYLEYGSYASGWQMRLGIKLWSGWPTFPQVFAQGTLVGGADELQAALEDGTFREFLDGGGAP